jgi:hypothetical protein
MTSLAIAVAVTLLISSSGLRTPIDLQRNARLYPRTRHMDIMAIRFSSQRTEADRRMTPPLTSLNAKKGNGIAAPTNTIAILKQGATGAYMYTRRATYVR